MVFIFQLHAIKYSHIASVYLQMFFMITIQICGIR